MSLTPAAPPRGAEHTARLLISCADGPGIVASISNFLFEQGANIVANDQHSTHPEHGTFFMRAAFYLPALEAGGETVTYEELHARLEEGDQNLLASAVLQDETNEAAISLSQGVVCLHRLERSGAQAQVTELKARVKEAERAGDQREALRLMAVLHQLERPE